MPSLEHFSAYRIPASRCSPFVCQEAEENTLLGTQSGFTWTRTVPASRLVGPFGAEPADDDVERHFGFKITLRMIDKLAAFDAFAVQAAALTF